MVRDFIPLDSSKVKDSLKSALEMTDGDFSGNKLGLSSKVVPVVCLNQAPKLMPVLASAVTAVQNTWYTLLDVKNARIIRWTIVMGTANEDLGWRATIDGVVLTGSRGAAVAASVYELYFDKDMTVESTTDELYNKSFTIEGRDIKLEFRKTSANGANTLTSTVLYQVW